MRITLLASSCLVFLLSGCSLFHPEPPACEAVVTKSSQGLHFRGLEIPTGISSTAAKIKIAGFEYDAKQAQEISDAILSLAEARRSQCNAWWALDRATPPASAAQIIEMQKVFDASKQAEMVLRNALATGDPQKVRQASQSMQSTASDMPRAVEKAILTPEVRSELTIPEGILNRIVVLESSVEVLQRLESSIEVLQRRVDNLPPVAMHGGIPPRSFSVKGFDTTGIGLTPSMKMALESEFKAAVAAFAHRPLPSLVIIGYADSSGAYLRNVDLGLQRATAVASYLKRNFPEAAEIRAVSSGGVLKGADARRVDVVLS